MTEEKEREDPDLQQPELAGIPDVKLQPPLGDSEMMKRGVPVWERPGFNANKLPFGLKSRIIRVMASQYFGMKTGEIAKKLGIRYQHAHNVISQMKFMKESGDDELAINYIYAETESEAEANLERLPEETLIAVDRQAEDFLSNTSLAQMMELAEHGLPSEAVSAEEIIAAAEHDAAAIEPFSRNRRKRGKK